MDDQFEPINGEKINLKRILIVDDAADTRLMISLRLRREGFEVSSASNGTQALNTIPREGLPNLAILDIMMPGMSGFDIAEEIRKLAISPSSSSQP